MFSTNIEEKDADFYSLDWSVGGKWPCKLQYDILNN